MYPGWFNDHCGIHILMTIVDCLRPDGLMQPREIARYILNDPQLWRGIIAVIRIYGYRVRACNWKWTSYIDTLATFGSAWCGSASRSRASRRPPGETRKNFSRESFFNILPRHGNPTEPPAAAVSWTRSIRERLENVAKRNETEQNNWDGKNEWTDRHGGGQGNEGNSKREKKVSCYSPYVRDKTIEEEPQSVTILLQGSVNGLHQGKIVFH